MAWRMILQPNGLLARFSDVVDNFTHVNLTKEEAFEVCFEELGRRDAEKKVEAGLKDYKPWTLNTLGNGSERWEHSLKKIEMIHGGEEVEQWIDICSTDPQQLL